MPNARTSKTTREKAAELRLQAEREAARKRTLFAGGLVVIVIVVAVAVTIFIRSLPTHSATPPNLVDNGFLVGQRDAKVTVELYEDFQCPICAEFEKASGPALADYVKGGKVRLVYHPVAILDQPATGTDYSSRAVNMVAAAVAHDPALYQKLNDSIFAAQPPENQGGLPNSKLVELATAAGLPNDLATKAAKEEPYRDWALNQTDAFDKKYKRGTPTIVVAGKVIESPTEANLKAAIDKAIVG